MAFLVALDNAMYLASTKEVATVACFFEDQEIELPAKPKTKPLVEQQLSWSCAQDESV